MPDRDENPWVLSYGVYARDQERQRETLFALGNGVVVVRGSWPGTRAGEFHYPGTYRAGLYARRTAEAGGHEFEFETVVNLPNWLALDLRLDGGPPLSIDDVAIEHYRHSLDLNGGITTREISFCDASGRRTAVTEKRLVSMARPRLAAVQLDVVPLDWSGQVDVRWGIDAGVRNRNVERYSRYPDRHLDVEAKGGEGGLVHVQTRTRGTLVSVGQALRMRVAGAAADGTEEHAETIAARHASEASPQRPLRVETVHGLIDSAAFATDNPGEVAARLTATAPGFSELETEHRDQWQRLWSAAGMEIADASVARPLHLHAFHILQTVSDHSRDCDCGVPARGWHGEAYGGHVFWDELFVLPFLRLRLPAQARELLLYRYRRLDAARKAARRAGCKGAMFPWRSAGDGREVTPERQLNLLSGRWMQDNTHLQRHIGAAVAYNIWHYFLATDDREFLTLHGAEMLLEIARFFASRARFDPRDGRYHLRGVVGPDEYHNAYPGAAVPGLDDNAYTNLMAVWVLHRAREALDCVGKAQTQLLLQRLSLGQDDFDLWEDIGQRMAIAFHSGGIIDQFEGFHRLAELEPGMIPERFAGARVDWALEAIGETADAYQVTKQADALTLFHLLPQEEVFRLLAGLGYSFGPAELRRTTDYYLARSTHRSSLSRVVYAGATAAIDLPLSWKLFTEALGTDLHALAGESIEEGVHLGAMGGTIDVLQRHYLGIRPTADGLSIRPRLPPELGDVRLRVLVKGAELVVRRTSEGLSVTSAPGNRAALRVDGPEGMATLHPGHAIDVPARPQQG